MSMRKLIVGCCFAICLLIHLSSNCLAVDPDENGGWSDVSTTVVMKKSIESRRLDSANLEIGTGVSWKVPGNSDSGVAFVSNYIRPKDRLVKYVYVDFRYASGYEERQHLSEATCCVTFVKLPSGIEYLAILSNDNLKVLGVFPFEVDGRLNLAPSEKDIRPWRNAFRK